MAKVVITGTAALIEFEARRKTGVRKITRHGELRYVDMGALAFGNESASAVGIPGTGRSRNLEEQAGQAVHASSSL